MFGLGDPNYVNEIYETCSFESFLVTHAYSLHYVYGIRSSVQNIHNHKFCHKTRKKMAKNPTGNTESNDPLLPKNTDVIGQFISAPRIESQPKISCENEIAQHVLYSLRFVSVGFCIKK